MGHTRKNTVGGIHIVIVHHHQYIVRRILDGQVALVTDGRMSGASGKVPAAIHVSPEAKKGGALALLKDGDVVRVCAETGELVALVDAADWAARTPAEAPDEAVGVGRELFALMRHFADPAERGGSAMLAVGGL